MSGVGPSAAGMRKRNVGAGPGAGRSRSASSGPSAGNQAGNAGAFSVRLYNETAPGFKVGPFFVVISSIVYLVIVVMLHIWGRWGSK